VAVIDSGVDATHPLLAAALLPELNFIGSWAAPTNHGTAVSSVILKADPAARILPINVLNGAERTSHELVSFAIREAVKRGASVINISLGSETHSTEIAPLTSALQYAADNDVVVVAAAGNNGDSGSGTVVPAAYDSVLAVGALTSSGEIASLSNRGSFVDVTALGEDVPIAEPGGGMTTESGTSFAAPLAAGLASALRRLHPEWSAIDVRNHILASASDAGAPGPDPVYGFGRLDIVRALSSDLLTPVGVSPQAVPFDGLKVKRVAGGVTLSSRSASRIFVRTASGENVEVGPSGSYLRVKYTDSFTMWSYDRSGAPTLPITRMLPGSKAPRIKATATFKNGRYRVKVSSSLPRGLSVVAAISSPDGATGVMVSTEARKLDIREVDVFVPVIQLCLSSLSDTFSCTRVKVKKLR
jgi:subtilisin family serine protease